MNNVKFNIHNACKILVASGIPKSDTKLILNTISRELKHSGPKFLVSRLKSLREFAINKYLGKSTQYSLPWFRKTQAGNPKDMGWRKLVRRDPEVALGAISGVLMSIYHVPDQETKESIYKNILTKDDIDFDNYFVKKFIDIGTLEFWPILYHMKYDNIRTFQPTTMKGVSFPLKAGIPYNVKVDKETGMKDTLQLIGAYHNSLLTAPQIVEKHIAKLEKILTSNISQMYFQEKQYLANLRRSLEWSSPGNKSFLDSDQIKSDFVNQNNGHIIGSIGVIPSPGYKDRVIANPNALVQSFLYNLGETLGDASKRHPCCFVYDQQEGISKVQSYLARGIKLASVDMSAATDRLSADVGFKLLKSIVEKCKTQLIKDTKVRRQNQGLSPILYDTDFDFQMKDYQLNLMLADIEFFEECARGNYYIGNLGTDGVEYVTYRQGQPMGLKPSFPLLTLMNITAGVEATYLYAYEKAKPLGMSTKEYLENNNIAMPIVVGDDIVLDANAFPYYNLIITSIGGKINLEKTAQSKDYAKFCSRIITKHKVIREKPRYVETSRFQNANTFKNFLNLRPWEKELFIKASSLSLEEEGIIHISNKIPFENRYIKKVLSSLYKQDLITSEKVFSPEVFKLIIDLSNSLPDKVKHTPSNTNLYAKMFARNIIGDKKIVEDRDNQDLDFITNLQQVSVPLYPERFDHDLNKHVQVKQQDSFFMQLQNIVDRENYDINEIHNVFLDYHPGQILIDKDTIIFQPDGAPQVSIAFDIKEVLHTYKSVEEFTNKEGFSKWKSDGYFKALERQLEKEYKAKELTL